MEELFLSFWNRGVSAGWLILAVAGLRLALKKAPKSVHCLLWLLVGVRLICPFSIQSAVSLIPSAETIPPVVLDQPLPQIHSGIAVLNGPVNEYLAGRVFEGGAQPAGYTRSITRTCAGIWLVGMVLMLLWALAGWLRLRRRVAEAVPEEDGAWLCDRIASPFLLGIFRPRICLPSGLDGESRTYVLAHEKAHIKRLDHLTKPAGFLLLSVYWFQPLVWLAYFLLCRDIELACDERVIRELGAECKKPYAEALLRCSVKWGGTAACPLAFGEVGVKERVKNVLNYKKPAFWLVAASLAVCAVAGVCFLTDPMVPPVEPVEPAPAQLSQNAVQTGHSHNHDHAHNYLPEYEEDELFSTYLGGALLYEPLTYSSYFPGWHASLKLTEDTLTVTEPDGTSTPYNLKGTVQYTPEEFYALFPDLRQQEADCGATLLPQDTETIACHIYQSIEAGDDGEFLTECIWKVTETDKTSQLWIGTGRLYALIHHPDWEGSFCYDNCVLWDYDPHVSTAVPIRFDMEGPVSVFIKSGTLLYGDAVGETGTKMEVAPGETVYWQPSAEGAPKERPSLIYTFSLEDGRIAQDEVELRPIMHGQGLYGSRTYGISNNWLGALSSAIHYSMVEADAETGELLIRLSEEFPYTLSTDGFPRVDGTRVPPQTVDAAAQ